MSDSVHVEFHVKQRARRGTTKCPHCDKPRVESSAYCREHRNLAQKEYRKRIRQELEEFRAQRGTWVEPA